MYLKLTQRLLVPKGSQCSQRGFKVAVVGAGGGIGQSLSLLLKQNPLVEELSLHDLAPVEGVRADLSHVDTPATVDAFAGDDKLKDALRGAQLVIVPAGLPRKPDMTRQQLIGVNASVAAKVAAAFSEVCPDALLAFITNPINTIVPIAAEVLKSKNVFDPNRLFGVTTLDVVRSKAFIADFMNINPKLVNIPVIGGHSGITILPLLSKCSPKFSGDADDAKRLTHRIQEAGTEVIKAKAGKGSATLSMAYAGAHFANALLKGLKGEADVIECAYVSSSVTKLPFFSTPLLLGKEGIAKNLGVPELNDSEQEAMEKLLPELKENIEVASKLAKEVLLEIECKAIADKERKEADDKAASCKDENKKTN